jgi:hypothetical protein
MKLKYKNTIRFNCRDYKAVLISKPANCYNCMLRNGYPDNLGGDESCKNFRSIETPPHAAGEGEGK